MTNVELILFALRGIGEFGIVTKIGTVCQICYNNVDSLLDLFQYFQSSIKLVDTWSLWSNIG